MGQQDGIFASHEIGGNMRFVFEDIQSGCKNNIIFQRIGERCLVHHAAPADIDQDAHRSERLQNRMIDDVFGAVPAWRHAHEDVDILCHVDER